MKYISTRGQAPVLGFCDAVMAGLASDGGLYVPETYPSFTPSQIAAFAGLSYEELFFEIVGPFVAGQIPDAQLKLMIKGAYSGFKHKAIAPLNQIGNQEFLLELFHGPTLAFKDFALQFLGRVFDYILSQKGQRAVVLGATSGDTGSAAIYGCMDSKYLDIFIMHPHGKVSNVQRKQMTTIIRDNVHNLAVTGNFDDCQKLVKDLFVDQGFLGSKTSLIAVNSINWCRIMAQIVYYFYAALQLGAPARSVAFTVPTGNFGDIFAGYVAHKMGLPISKLVIATNKNDILHRFIENNDYSQKELQASYAPSMDIQVSSNFERLLFDLYDNDGDAIRNLMADFKAGGFVVKDSVLRTARQLFASYSVSDALTIETVRKIYGESAIVIDPHTAIGVAAAREITAKEKDSAVPMVILATAHPAKFDDAVAKAGIASTSWLQPECINDLNNLPEKYQIVAADGEKVKQKILEVLKIPTY